MLNLPFALTSLIVGFAPLFSKPVWANVQVLLVGAILTPGRRAVTSALRVMGLSRGRHFQTYHRVLNRAAWSSLSASRILLSLIVETFAPEGALVFALSYRDVEEIMAVRGIVVTYEAIREWCLKFGQTYANDLRRRRPRPADKWHLDEMFIRVNGKEHYLWRAVDQDGNVLDILVQSRRNKKAAKRFFRKLLKRLQYVPRVIITDKLRSYSAAKAEIMPGVEHRRHKGLNNRAENRASTDQSTRARDATVQISRPCTTVPISLRDHLKPLPTSQTSADGRAIP